MTTTGPRGSYPRGFQFPNEGFVQKAIERYFANRGLQLDKVGTADLACTDPNTAAKWIVEAKGETSSVGLDFRTGLGQLLQQMTEPTINYAIAVPDTPQFRYQCERLSSWVRIALHLHLLLISAEGEVRVIEPDSSIP